MESLLLTREIYDQIRLVSFIMPMLQERKKVFKNFMTSNVYWKNFDDPLGQKQWPYCKMMGGLNQSQTLRQKSIGTKVTDFSGTRLIARQNRLVLKYILYSIRYT